jgi:hypothetical protein
VDLNITSSTSRSQSNPLDYQGRKRKIDEVVDELEERVQKICSSKIPVTQLDFSNKPLTNGQLERVIVAHPELTDLYLTATDLTDGAGASIKQLKHLQWLDLTGSIDLTNNFVNSISTISTLTFLKLDLCLITDNCGSSIGNLKKLKFLSLAGCEKITNRFAQFINELPELENLDVAYCRLLTNEFGRGLVGHVALKKINANYCQSITVAIRNFLPDCEITLT